MSLKVIQSADEKNAKFVLDNDSSPSRNLKVKLTHKDSFIYYSHSHREHYVKSG